MVSDFRRPAAGLLAALLAAGLAGCSGGSAPKTNVSGKVTYNGQPLNKPDGTIVFVGPDGTQVSATINSDGTYTAEGVSAGENKVGVYYPNPAAGAGGGGGRRRIPQPGGAAKTNTPPPSPFLTPADFASPDTSMLTVNVTKDTVYDVPLTGPPIK